MENMLGAYGEWAAGLIPDPPRLSFRRPEFKEVARWRQTARRRFHELLLAPNSGGVPKAKTLHHYEFEGVTIEQLQWQLPYGPPTEAVLLKPAGAKGKLPGVLGLHCHGGNKYLGWRKIAQTGPDLHPMVKAHHDRYYGGVAWANQLAKRGYVVLVHDTFTFASRRMRPADLPASIKRDLIEPDPQDEKQIAAYNQFAGAHEHIIAKSLFCAGTTWPGVFVSDDRRALDYLCSRPEVDAARAGCCGLSGGGLRTIFLTGADERIKCACPVGMTTTWRDYLLNKSFTHTWMCYVPGLANELDYPEILGLAAPQPVFVLNDREDQLFTMPEMERADRILAAVYEKAGAKDKYKCTFYPGPHKFDLDMQRDAFAWFDRWLKS